MNWNIVQFKVLDHDQACDISKMICLAGNNEQPDISKNFFDGSFTMSAASQSLGLAQSQKIEKTDWNDYENPARAWIDLVAAFDSGNADSVRACLALAKASHWTHGDFDRSLAEVEEEEDPDYSSEDEFPATQKWNDDWDE